MEVYFHLIGTCNGIIKLILDYILYFNYYLFQILTLYYFTPTHILISYEISKIFKIFKNYKENSELSILPIILFIFEFFCLLIYLEIIELNFCGLNKNVKRNISIRGNDEMIQIRSLDDLVTELDDISMDEYDPGFYTKKTYVERGISKKYTNDFVDKM